MVKRGKNAAFALSINAIVIIILAITFLALSIGFMKGMFTKSEQTVEEVLGSARQCKKEPSSAEPMTACPDKVVLKGSESGVVNVGYYNVNNYKGVCIFGVSGGGTELVVPTETIEVGANTFIYRPIIANGPFSNGLSSFNLEIRCLSEEQLIDSVGGAATWTAMSSGLCG